MYTKIVTDYIILIFDYVIIQIILLNEDTYLQLIVSASYDANNVTKKMKVKIQEWNETRK